MPHHGVLNLLKPPGMTSHDAVAFVRRVLGEKRVGHTGTLDPAAAGVLPICVGQATRLVENLQAGTKEYLAEATFGFQTDTLDVCGQTIAEEPASSLSLEHLEAILPQFRGETLQNPPMFSALKQGGQKLHELARQGIKVEIPNRKITISHLELLRFEPGERPRAFLHIECSGGTYIRSLVRDLGLALGTVATMSFLVRNRSGRFSLQDAISVENFAAQPKIRPLVEFLPTFAATTIQDDEMTANLAMGKFLEHAAPFPALFGNAAGSLWVLTEEVKPGIHKPDKVFDLREK